MPNRQLKSGIILSYIFVLVNIISGVFFTPFLIKSLGQSQYGLYEIIVSLASNLALLNLGMSDSIVKYVAKYKAENNKEKEAEIIATIIKILIAISIIGGIICFFIYLNFNSIYAKSLTLEEREQGRIMFIIASLNLMVSLPGSTFGNVLCAYEQFGLIRALGIIKTIFRIILIVAFVLLLPKAIVILLIDTVLNILLIFVHYVIVRKKLDFRMVWKKSDKSLLKEVFSFSAYVMFFMIAREVQFQTDKTIIGLRMSTVWVTIYAAGSKMSATYNQLGQTLSGMYLPRAMNIKNDYSGDERENHYRNYIISMGRILLPITSVVLIGFIGLGQNFIILWIGEGYNLAYISASIMMLALYLPILEDTGLAILKAEGKQGVIAITWLISSILNVVLTWIVIPFMGIVGASIMTLLTSYCINLVSLNIILKREIGLKIWKTIHGIFKGSLPVFLGSIIFFIALHLSTIDDKSWFCFIIEGGVYVIIYISLVFIFYLNEMQKNKIVAKIRSKINRKCK